MTIRHAILATSDRREPDSDLLTWSAGPLVLQASAAFA